MDSSVGLVAWQKLFLRGVRRHLTRVSTAVSSSANVFADGSFFGCLLSFFLSGHLSGAGRQSRPPAPAAPPGWGSRGGGGGRHQRQLCPGCAPGRAQAPQVRGTFETPAPAKGFPSRNSRGKESAHLLRLFSKRPCSPPPLVSPVPRWVILELSACINLF